MIIILLILKEFIHNSHMPSSSDYPSEMFYVLKHQMISESMNQNLIDTSQLASLVMEITHHSVSLSDLEFT